MENLHIIDMVEQKILKAKIELLQIGDVLLSYQNIEFIVYKINNKFIVVKDLFNSEWIVPKSVIIIIDNCLKFDYWNSLITWLDY